MSNNHWMDMYLLNLLASDKRLTNKLPVFSSSFKPSLVQTLENLVATAAVADNLHLDCLFSPWENAIGSQTKH